MKNTATAIWKGRGADGSGELNTASSALKKTPYSYRSRTENNAGTNPEELIAAAHAGCFAMKLAFAFESSGYIADEIHATCEVSFERGEVTSSHIDVKVKAKNIREAEFQELAADSGQNCPISKLLKTEVKVTAALI